jgi:glutaconyl-CoA/methylmalonyl-CoA decarboxylase subunit gamma
VEVRGHRFPVTLVGSPGETVELEIGGERVIVEGWPVAAPLPTGPIDVNGERWSITVERAASSGPPTRPPETLRTSQPPSPTGPAAAAPPSGDGAEGIAIVPPMPGKVIELRVKEGDRVTAGQPLLVLEAMKMRNEIVAPAAGVVERIRVVAGGNARAREPILFVVPD